MIVKQVCPLLSPTVFSYSSFLYLDDKFLLLVSTLGVLIVCITSYPFLEEKTHTDLEKHTFSDFHHEFQDNLLFSGLVDTLKFEIFSSSSVTVR